MTKCELKILLCAGLIWLIISTLLGGLTWWGCHNVIWSIVIGLFTGAMLFIGLMDQVSESDLNQLFEWLECNELE